MSTEKYQFEIMKGELCVNCGLQRAIDFNRHCDDCGRIRAIGYDDGYLDALQECEAKHGKN